MTKFEMIKYHGQTYPASIPLRMEEIAAHFDVKSVNGLLGYSLHTEYSYGKRKFSSSIISRFPELISAQKEGVPQLWKNESWASQFTDFIIDLLDNKVQPKVIEIHPPFNDYADMDSFIKNYAVFESKIKASFPNVEILIENRCGSIYHGGKFILSKTQDIYRLAEFVEREGLRLKMAYDVPQIYTAYNAKTKDDYIHLLEDIKDVREFIGGVHLWGKRISESGRKVAHYGDLNSYFGNSDIKEAFLETFKDCFDDGITRKMVLEVNSGNKDLNSIVNDLLNVGIEFK